VEDFNGVELCGRGVYIGSRGENGSGRFVRVYDKGLESGQAAAGEIIRWELESSADVARQIWADFVAVLGNDSSGGATALLAARVVGAVDFRTPDCRLDRSERSSWWSAFLELVGRPVLCRARQKVTRLAGHVAWLRRTVVPKIAACAKATGQDFKAVALELLSAEGIRASSVCSIVVQEYVKLNQAVVAAAESVAAVFVPRPVRYGLPDVWS
jgi:hypothetical protein